jgi:hypothetical protein
MGKPIHPVSDKIGGVGMNKAELTECLEVLGNAVGDGAVRIMVIHEEIINVEYVEPFESSPGYISISTQ